MFIIGQGPNAVPPTLSFFVPRADRRGRAPRKLVAALATPSNLVTLSRLALIGAAFAAAGLGAPRLALTFGASAGVSAHVVCAIGAGALPLGALVPWALREIWVVCLRRSSIELGENIPTHWTGKLKSTFVGWSALPLFAGLLRVFGDASGFLVALGRAGVAIGIARSVVSALAYTAAWVRIYEARAPEPPGSR